MADKVKEARQLAFLKAKYPGVGDADTSGKDLTTTIRRDTLAALAMHDPILTYNAVATNQHRETARQDMIKKMAQ